MYGDTGAFKYHIKGFNLMMNFVICMARVLLGLIHIMFKHIQNIRSRNKGKAKILGLDSIKMFLILVIPDDRTEQKDSINNGKNGTTYDTTKYIAC